HALIEQAAYQSLARSKRRDFHGQIGAALAEHFSEIATTQPEILAYHYMQAGDTEQSVRFWRQAGLRAAAASANQEAVSHLTQALELLKHLPDSSWRVQEELRLELALGTVEAALHGYAAAQVGDAYARAHELSLRIPESPYLVRVLTGLAGHYVVRTELALSRRLAEQALAIAERSTDQTQLASANLLLGLSLTGLGNLADAHPYLQRAVTLTGSPPLERRYITAAPDPGVVARVHYLDCLWLQGFPDQALIQAGDAVRLAEQLSHPHSPVFAVGGAANVSTLRGDFDSAEMLTRSLEQSAATYDFSYFSALALLFAGWIAARRGAMTDALEQMRAGVAAYRTAGSDTLAMAWLARFAEVLRRTGQVQESLTIISEALAQVTDSGERYMDAELHRERGEALLLASPDNGEVAEECFREALRIARRQGAKSFELRAATSLARAWARRGMIAEARQLVSTCYRWFTEGLTTADLREAAALIQMLDSAA
ncbi:MAG: hypothetical protein ACR2PL_15445, partial [Dehalococcoidia bacterium]